MSSTPLRSAVNGFPRGPNGTHLSARRGHSMTRDGGPGAGLGAAAGAEEEERDEDPIHRSLMNRWAENQAAIAVLFSKDGRQRRASSQPQPDGVADADATENAKTSNIPKKPARVLDEDYGDDDDEEEEEELEKQSPLKSKGKGNLPNGLLSHAVRTPSLSRVPTLGTATSTSTEQPKTSEDVRKQLEEDKKAAAEAAKKSFQSMFFTLENDRDAMLEQQKLDELDREVENEISGEPNASGNAAGAAPGSAPHANVKPGSLGSADLGASSLTLKHLIARIDMQRGMVKASDNQLRTLISEVRKGRSKWASEDRVGQEELYEAAEKVLVELKAMTGYAQPFLQRVSKREAPDYFNVIKHPMDIGTMMKKLNQRAYKSKRDFVDDLNLIWANCLKYNQEPTHPLRKKALYMRKETDKLTPLIPEVVIRDRAEVEAEERRLQSMGADDSDDDDAPIMASRGRKAPKKGVTSSGRKAPSDSAEEKPTPAPEARPALHASASNLRADFLRADSEMMDANSTGTGTPPPGNATPGLNGLNGVAAAGSQIDIQEVDGLTSSLAVAPLEDLDEDDTEFKTWKQVTKKDRAMAAAERNRLFRGEQLNLEEPALLRSKAMMRRWLRQQKHFEQLSGDANGLADAADDDPTAGGETLAEGIETEEDSTLPDYYNALSALPELNSQWRWTTDFEGCVIPRSDEWMRLYPRKQYVSNSEGSLCRRMEANMKQMQDTRTICAKIGIVKQMQIQAQV